jgi:hypothetical protein
LTPDDGALALGVDATAPPTDEVCGDGARVLGATDVEGAFGSADLLSKGPSWALSSGPSYSPSIGAEAGLDAREVDPPPTGPCRDRTLGSYERKVVVSYRDPASLSPLSSLSSPEAIS